MNLIRKFLIFFTVIAFASADDDDDRMSVKDIAEALMSFAEDCDPKPEEEHIVEVVKNIEDAQYISKCFRHCLLAQFELIQQNSLVLDKEKTVEMMGAMFSDRKDDLGEIVDVCNDKNQAITEKCENAHAHGMCIFSEMKERSFDIPELRDE